MKKYLKISVILCSIALVCALVLASLNLLTSPIIAKNTAKSQEETLQSIYAEYDASKSEDIDVNGKDSKIQAIKLVKNSNGDVLGYVYTVSGTNAYGSITLMVAITKDGAVHQVEFLENGQSFASTVDAWVKETFISKGADKHEGGFVGADNSQTEDVTVLPSGDELKCGATYGSTLVRDLVAAALNDAKEVK